MSHLMTHKGEKKESKKDFKHCTGNFYLPQYGKPMCVHMSMSPGCLNCLFYQVHWCSASKKKKRKKKVKDPDSFFLAANQSL